MTLEEMKKSDKKTLSPEDVRGLLGCKTYSMNVTARAKGLDAFPFPCFWSGNRLRIPRLAFIEWAEKTKLA